MSKYPKFCDDPYCYSCNMLPEDDPERGKECYQRIADTSKQEVIKIDPAGKYVIILSSRESPEAVQRAKQRLDEWWHNPDERFAFLSGRDIKLVKVDEEGDEG